MARIRGVITGIAAPIIAGPANAQILTPPGASTFRDMMTVRNGVPPGFPSSVMIELSVPNDALGTYGASPRYDGPATPTSPSEVEIDI